MTAGECDGRRLVLAGFVMVSLVLGCQKGRPPSPPGTASTDSADGAPMRPAEPRSVPSPRPAVADRQTLPPAMGASPQAGDDAESVQNAHKPDVPLSDEEQRKLTALREWVREMMWSGETDPNFKRQRPVGLIVLRPDRLPSSIPTSLEYAGALANINWDMKILLHMTGSERRDLNSLKDLHDGINKINADITRRNEVEAGELPAGVAPLRRLGAPELFTSVRELETSIDRWLSTHFLMTVRSDSEVNKGVAASRPPFGGISFSGHGRRVRLDKKGVKSRENSTPQFKVSDGEWFELTRLDDLVLRKYQAPVWVLTDICREVIGVKTRTRDGVESRVANLEPREFDNGADLPAGAKNLVQECERLRANVSAGFLHRGGSVVTRLDATEQLTSLDDKPECLLQHQVALLTDREEVPSDIARANFKRLPAPATSITLAQVRAWATERFKARSTKPRDQRPELSRGTFSDQAVVFSTLRGKDAYPPQYPNLLGGGLSFVRGGFTVPEFDGNKDLEDPAHYGPVTVVRQQAKYNSNFKAIFKFNKPYDLIPDSEYQLVLLVSASGAVRTDTISFTTGVYNSDNQLLNTSFKDYDESESFRQPIVCDEVMRLIHTPLTLFNDPDVALKFRATPKSEVANFEIQATPLNPETSWERGGALTVHAVYLVSSHLPDDQLKLDIQRSKANTPFEKMCLWDVPLHSKPEAVSIAVGPNATVMKQSVRDHSGLWGMAGEVYPKMHMDAGTRQVRLKVDVEAGSVIGEQAEVSLCLYSNKRVMIAWSVPLRRAVAKEQVIPISESGMVQEVAMVVRNHTGPLKITRLDIETNPQSGK